MVRLATTTKRALSNIQRRLERFYALEPTPPVGRFAHAAAEGERETLFVRETGSDVELALVVPTETPSTGANDTWLQLAEGVSHFVYVVERVRTGLPATQLELELQAEVDKFVLLGLEPGFDREQAEQLHTRLFEGGRFLDPEGSEAGERYRLANDLAARLALRLIRRDGQDAHALLRRFYRAGQTDKIALARAA
jgi:hypothetical protein